MGLAEKTDLKVPPTWQTTLARWISVIIHPIAYPLVTLALITYAATNSVPLTVRFVLVALALTTVPISLLVGYQVLRGHWTDLDVSVRHQRYLLYPFGLACMIALAAAFVWLGAPRISVRATLALIAANLLDGVINFVYKVSAHATGAAICAVLLIAAFPSVRIIGVLAGCAALAVGWSRVALGRHTGGQVVLGWIVGVGATVALISAALPPQYFAHL